VLARAVLAPAYGAAIALAFALSWGVLQRGLDGRTLLATAYFGLAGTLAALAALVAGFLLRTRAASARFAAALVLLLLGTAGFAGVFLTLQLVLTFHRLNEVPLKIALLILGISGAGALYNVLAIAAPLILPLGLPAVVLFAILIARRPR
jgi:hypothetical protein